MSSELAFSVLATVLLSSVVLFSSARYLAKPLPALSIFGVCQSRAILAYIVIVGIQFLFGGQQLGSDGVLEVGFPYVFYSDSALGARIDVRAFETDLRVLGIFAMFYGAIHALGLPRLFDR